MFLVLAWIAGIVGCAWLGTHGVEGAFSPMVAGVILLPVVIWGAWVTR